MNRWKVLVSSISVLCVGVLGATLLPATGQVGGNRFILCEKDGRFDFEHDVDTPPRNEFSPGDAFIFTETEFDENGRRVGKLVGKGTVIKRVADGEDALIQFNVSLNIDGGRIEIQASSTFGNINSTKFAITGGTGKWAGKTGTVAPKRRSCNGVAKEGRGDSLVVRFD